jgi:hypothetical protein
MAPWDEKLFLLTEEELNELPDGIVLTSIMGDTAVKGKDYIDTDSRFGHTAYGITDPFNHPLKELFIKFRLKSNI